MKVHEGMIGGREKEGRGEGRWPNYNDFRFRSGWRWRLVCVASFMLCCLWIDHGSIARYIGVKRGFTFLRGHAGDAFLRDPNVLECRNIYQARGICRNITSCCCRWDDTTPTLMCDQSKRQTRKNWGRYVPQCREAACVF